MHVVLFEGRYWSQLAPLSFGRPVFLLASGAGTLLDKQIRHLKPSRLTLWVRPEMAEFCERRVVPRLGVPTAVNAPLDDAPALVISGRTLHFADYEVPPHPAVALDDHDAVRSAYVVAPGLSPADAMGRTDAWLRLQDLPHMMPQSRLAGHAWDLLNWNEESIVADFVSGPPGPPSPAGTPALPAGPYHVVEPASVRLGPDVTLGPGCVLDAGRGPVLIAGGASIGANAVVQGPCAIGPHAVVSPMAVIRPGTTLGPMCKVGGEVSNSIFQGRGNKAHDGFVGDSYVGEWVNLGAGTVTSNLKNTYDEVSLPLAGVETPTGRRFVGSLIGDHAKTAVGTRLMTGSYVGYSSMLATSGLAPRYVPGFTFLTDRGPEPYRRDKAIEVMRAVMSRRNVTFNALDESIADYAAGLSRTIEKPIA